MNKREIQALDNSELMAHAMNMESECTKEENSRRGITIKTKKDYMWTVEELCKRFDLDLDKLTKETGSDHWWEEK